MNTQKMSEICPIFSPSTLCIARVAKKNGQELTQNLNLWQEQKHGKINAKYILMTESAL